MKLPATIPPESLVAIVDSREQQPLSLEPLRPVFSQASMAVAERWRIDPEFVETVIEPLREEAKEARSEGGKKAGRGRKLPEIIPEAKHKRESRTKLAKLHGTNATYVLLNRQWKRDVAKKLL